MSKDKTTYLEALHSLSDHYLDNLESMTLEELQAEHSALYGDSARRIQEVDSFVSNVMVEMKKELFNEKAASEEDELSKTLVERIKHQYGSVRAFIDSKIKSEAPCIDGLTLAYRNHNENRIGEQELEGVLEDMIKVGQVTPKDI